MSATLSSGAIRFPGLCSTFEEFFESYHLADASKSAVFEHKVEIIWRMSALGQKRTFYDDHLNVRFRGKTGHNPSQSGHRNSYRKSMLIVQTGKHPLTWVLERGPHRK